MLIISRKAGESFFIGDDIEIVILETQEDKIKIGISAPRNVEIVRNELRETKKANLDAAQSQVSEVLDIFKKKNFKKSKTAY